MVRRETDPTLINSLSNLPDIHPAIARHGKPLEWSAAMRGCVVLSNGEDAVQVYEQSADRDWQVMTVFGPTCRGKRALEVAMEMRKYMEPHADLIFGSVPDALPHAKWFYAKLGGQKVDSVESGGVTYVAQDNETLYAFKVNG